MKACQEVAIGYQLRRSRHFIFNWSKFLGILIRKINRFGTSGLPNALVVYYSEPLQLLCLP